MTKPLNPDQPIFVRYPCGCIGLSPEPGISHQLIIYHCDADHNPYYLEEHKLLNPSFTPLTREEVTFHLRAIFSYLHEGERFRQLKEILK